MKNKLFFTGIIIITISYSAISQENTTVEEYISLYKNLAIEEMKTYHIPASITLAQGILESECGNSQLALRANNHFGIKCHKEWTGKTFYQDDDEKNECFRKYTEPGQSFADHSAFLTTRDRYKFLFDLDISDYKGWAYGLKQAGYATNPRYPELLIKIIEENGLDAYDKVDSHQSLVVSQKSSNRKSTSESKTHNSEPKTQNSALSTQHSELTTALPDVFEISGRGGNSRMIFLNNGVKFIMAREGDDIYKIAEEFNIYSWQIREYNDLEKKDHIAVGQKVYLEKKKRYGASDIHVVMQGDDLHSVSQAYGIKLKTLCRLNKMGPTDQLTEGEKLRLR
jgi:LysM repeat protein